MTSAHTNYCISHHRKLHEDIACEDILSMSFLVDIYYDKPPATARFDEEPFCSPCDDSTRRGDILLPTVTILLDDYNVCSRLGEEGMASRSTEPAAALASYSIDILSTRTLTDFPLRRGRLHYENFDRVYDEEGMTAFLPTTFLPTTSISADYISADSISADFISADYFDFCRLLRFLTTTATATLISLDFRDFCTSRQPTADFCTKTLLTMKHHQPQQYRLIRPNSADFYLCS